MRSLSVCVLLLVGPVASCVAADRATYDLTPQLREGDVTAVKVTLEVGGDMLLTDEKGEQKLPLTVGGELRYVEQMLAWSAETDQPARSLRQYDTAQAKIQIGESGVERELPTAKRTIVAELSGERATLSAADEPLTRDQYDLVNVVGNTLALNRLLPSKELAEGDSWKHERDTIGALLGMDNVAVCEVTSVITGCERRQVQIRLAGTVHGTIDGAPTEMQLRGAYLFHEQQQRITKFNLAIKESRTRSQVVPGLDVVAKISLSILPNKKSLSEDLVERFAKLDEPLSSSLRYEAAEHGYRFLHDDAWYVIAEQSDRVSLRSLQNGNQTAHCSLTTLPARSAGRETSLEEFEGDVREMLGDHLTSVTAASNWTTRQGHDCLGVVAHGEIEGVAIEWRYYLISSPDKPRVSLSVTVEQSQLELFADADRQIVDSLELVELPSQSTASKGKRRVAR